jgi:hypothetical protein
MAQAEAMQVQREMAMAALEEQRAKARELNARAAKMEAEANLPIAGGDAQAQADMQDALMQVRSETSAEIDRLGEQLRKAQAELANRTLQINRDADAKIEAAKIDADAKARVADIQAVSDGKLQAIDQRLQKMQEALDEKLRQQELAARERDVQAKERAASDTPAAATAAAPASAPPAAAPVTINVQVDAKTGEVKKSVVVRRDAEGNIVGADVQETDVQG